MAPPLTGLPPGCVGRLGRAPTLERNDRPTAGFDRPLPRNCRRSWLRSVRPRQRYPRVCPRRRAQLCRQVGLLRWADDRSVADEGNSGRSCRPHRAGAARIAAGRVRPRNAGFWLGDNSRRQHRHWDRRPDAGWRLWLAVWAVRARLRQSGGGRRRHCRRTVAARERSGK
jgi:hypothetical protein